MSVSPRGGGRAGRDQSALKPIEALPADVVSGLRGIFCDIDDTLTWHGKLIPSALQALFDAQREGLYVVPVTGRPGGWVDHLARMWPVDGVVGENGGLWFWTDDDGQMQRRFLQSERERLNNRERLNALALSIVDDVPGAGIASDQPYRDLDLAVDFCEDVPRLDDPAIDKIVGAFEHAGAVCKVSSIHVNGWYGNFDKLTGCRRFCSDRWGIDLDAERDRWLYVGDSANDEPLFEFFDHSVGVANVADFLDRMSSWPTYVTADPGGHGFTDLVQQVLQRRRSAEWQPLAEGRPVVEAQWTGPDGQPYPVRLWAPRCADDGETWVVMMSVGLWHGGELSPVFGGSALQALALTSEVLEAAWHTVPRDRDPIRELHWRGRALTEGPVGEVLAGDPQAAVGVPVPDGSGFRCGVRLDHRLEAPVALYGADPVEALMHACRLVRHAQSERWRDQSLNP